MMFRNPLKKCEFIKCGLCDKPCRRPPCKPQCPCIKKIEEVREDLHTLEGKVDKNTQKIENNYNLLNDAISDLAEKHAQDHNYVINYIDQKDAENDYLLQQEIARAKAAEQDIDDRLAKEIRDRIEDVNNEETRATAAEQALDAKINQEIADRIADVDAEEERAKQAENDLSDRLDQEIQDRIADVNAEEDRAKAAEVNITNNLNQEIQNRINGDNILQQNINNLEQKHDQDIQDMNDHLDDILGIDAQGVSEIKAILSDNDTTTGLITELTKKANKSNMTAGTYKSVTVNQEGIVTAGTNPTTLAGYGITNAYTKGDVDAIINGLVARLTVLESYWRLNTTTNRLETSYVIEPEGYR